MVEFLFMYFRGSNRAQGDALPGPKGGAHQGPREGPLHGPRVGPLHGSREGSLQGPREGTMQGPSEGSGPDASAKRALDYIYIYTLMTVSRLFG